MRLQPESTITPDALATGQRALVRDAAWASVTGSLSGGVVLVAMALQLGAGPLAIGVLGAIPFVAQLAQLPAVALVERVRQRKKLGVLALAVARLLIFSLALLPLWPPEVGLSLLIGAQLCIAALGSTAACAINSWLHQLLPRVGLGSFFARRLLWATGMSCVATLAVGLLVEHAPGGNRMLAFSLSFAGAGLAGLMSTLYLARCPEPVMPRNGAPAPLWAQLRAPFADKNFRALLRTQATWSLATNLVAPFLALYLIRQLGYGLSTVTALWAASQVSNTLTLFSWGRVSDKLSNKSILMVAVPLYFGCTLGLVFVPAGPPGGLQLGMLFGLHVAMGAAGGGIGLATGNLGLKLAPQGGATAYLAAIGLSSAVAGGTAPLVGGALAQWFSERQLSLVVRWVSPSHTQEMSVLSFAHWEFLFAISALLGLYVLHAAYSIQEGGDVSERRVIQELGLEALRTVNHLSSIGGVLGSLFPFGRLSDLWRAMVGSPRPPP